MVRGSEPTTWLGLIRGSGEDLGSAMVRLAELAAQMHERELAEAAQAGDTDPQPAEAPVHTEVDR